MASVITLCLAPGRDANEWRPSKKLLDPNHLRGDLFRGNYVRKDVMYRNVPGMAGAEECRDNLDVALHAYPGHKMVVESHSMGTQGANKWLRDIGPSSDIDPDDVIFVGTGNLERKYGGAGTVPEVSGISADYGGIGIPDDTPYTVYDIARQYEFFCDYPTGTMNDLAALNALAGFFLHLDYSQVAINDPRNITYTEGNRHYILAPTWPVPKAGLLRSTAKADQRDGEDRPGIEDAFDRPYEVPTPTVRRIVAGLGWDTATKRLVSTSVPRWKPFG